MKEQSPLCIIKIEEQLASTITYENLDSDPTYVIQHDVLPVLDFLGSTHQVDHRTRNHLTLQKLAYTMVLYGLLKIYIPNLLSTKTLMYSTFLWPPQNPCTLPWISLSLLQPKLSIWFSLTKQLLSYVTS